MFYKDYSNPGKGVNKRNPNQPRWQVFLDVLPRKLWDLFKLNILYLLVSAPFFVITMIVSGVITSPIINSASQSMLQVNLAGYDVLLRVFISFLFVVFVGTGPATAGFSYVIREHANEHPCMLISDFFERFRLNFKQSLLLWVIDLIVFYVFSVAIGFYGETGNIIFQYIFMVVSVVYIMMHIYIYQMMITFDLSLKNIIKNSLLITIGKAPLSLSILVCNILVYIILPFFVLINAKSLITILLMVLVEIAILPFITQFATAFCVIPVLKKYVSDIH